jgi:hypothetical protein
MPDFPQNWEKFCGRLFLFFSQSFRAAIDVVGVRPARVVRVLIPPSGFSGFAG